jgi:hypothetical protein
MAEKAEEDLRVLVRAGQSTVVMLLVEDLTKLARKKKDLRKPRANHTSNLDSWWCVQIS